jgi:hypothetical protein
VELPLDLCSTLDVRFLRTTLVVLDGFSSGIELTLDLVFVRSEEFKDHRPNKLHFFGVVRWKRRSKFSQVFLIGSKFFSDLINNGGKGVLDVSEQDTCKFLNKDIATKSARWHA